MYLNTLILSEGKLIIGLCMAALCMSGFASVQTVKTGIATPQVNSEIGNVELLRERAIRNAMDLALLEVKGTMVSSEQSVSIKSSDKTNIRDNVGSSTVQQESRFNDNSLTRTEGHIRVLEIIDEWSEQDQYHVKVKLEILSEKEELETLDVGFYWERIGKPAIAISIKETVNDRIITGDDTYTLRFFRDVLTNNSINAILNPTKAHRYKIEVIQEVSIQPIKAFGTYAAHCNLSFKVNDTLISTTLVEERATHGPQAGFSPSISQRDCIKKIAPDLSIKLIRSLANIFNDKWNQGEEYTIQLAGLPGDHLTEVVDVINHVFRISNTRVDKYSNDTLIVKLRYQGKREDLSRDIISGIEDMGYKLVPESVDQNVIGLRWLDSSSL